MAQGKKPFFTSLIFLFVFGLGSCKSEGTSDSINGKQDTLNTDQSKAGLLKQIKQLEDTLFASEKLNVESGNKAIALYQQFHKYYWQDTICVDFLFKAAEISDNMGFPQKAIELYQECYDYYPFSSLAPYCLFRSGNIYQFTLHDHLNAKLAYNDCIKLYPNSQVAKDAAALIGTVGKDDNELIRDFQKNENNPKNKP